MVRSMRVAILTCVLGSKRLILVRYAAQMSTCTDIVLSGDATSFEDASQR